MNYFSRSSRARILLIEDGFELLRSVIGSHPQSCSLLTPTDAGLGSGLEVVCITMPTDEEHGKEQQDELEAAPAPAAPTETTCFKNVYIDSRKLSSMLENTFEKDQFKVQVSRRLEAHRLGRTH